MEGYTVNDLAITSMSNIYIENIETDQLFIESFNFDIQFIMEASRSTNLKNKFIEYLKKVITWLKQKIMQFIKFIKNKFLIIRRGSKKLDTKSVTKRSKRNRTKIKLNKSQNKIEKKDDKSIIITDEDMKSTDPEFDDVEDQYNDYIAHDSGAIEYIPDNPQITIFEKIMNSDDFFEEGYMKVHKAINEYIEKLESEPLKHNEIITADEILDKENFLNKIFKKALSVEYNKKEIFKKIYGDVVTKDATTRDLIDLTNKLHQIDYECEVFAKWIQRILPDSLNRIENSFQSTIRGIQFRLTFEDNIDEKENKDMIEELNTCLAKIVKLIEMQMMIIQIFATIHSQVFIHLKSEVDNLSWAFEQPDDYDFGTFDDDGWDH